MKKLNKRKGFTLIELVIVVAIIGILALMIIPQFNNVTEDAKVKTFTSNHRTIVSAIGMYQAAHQGDYPDDVAKLDPYLSESVASMKAPTGATYTYTYVSPTKATLVSEYNGTKLTYPSVSSSGNG